MHWSIHLAIISIADDKNGCIFLYNHHIDLAKQKGKLYKET